MTEGKIVGWFQDKMEFGLQALGNYIFYKEKYVAIIQNIRFSKNFQFE